MPRSLWGSCPTACWATRRTPSGRLSTVREVTAPQVFVDYSLVGHGRRFRTRVEAALRGQLHAGDTVVVLGDDVAPARARVLVVDDPEVETRADRRAGTGIWVSPPGGGRADRRGRPSRCRHGTPRRARRPGPDVGAGPRDGPGPDRGDGGPGCPRRTSSSPGPRPNTERAPPRRWAGGAATQRPRPREAAGPLTGSRGRMAGNA